MRSNAVRKLKKAEVVVDPVDGSLLVGISKETRIGLLKEIRSLTTYGWVIGALFGAAVTLIIVSVLKSPPL